MSVEVSETLARMLKRRGLKHEVLNAKYHEREAEIVAQAGRAGSITIATNMAGRGTDIKLGTGVKRCRVCGIQSREPAFGQMVETPDLSQPEIRTLGCYDDPPCGLVIIGTERHESRRIDRQLRGRSGRQGDPGQSIFFLSLEDDLMRLFGSDRIARWMDRSAAKDKKNGKEKEEEGENESEVLTHPLLTRAIGQAQKRVELQNFQTRKRLLDYDDVMNQQREVIYSLRRYALEGGEELKGEAVRMICAATRRLAEGTLVEFPDEPERWDRELLDTEFLQRFLLSVPGITDPAATPTLRALTAAAEQAGRDGFQAKLDYLREFEGKLGTTKLGEQMLSHYMLATIDEKWKDHLYDLDQLRAAIQYRAWGQKDPLIEYKQEAFDMFKGLMDDLQSTFAERWLRLQVEIRPAPPSGARGGAAAVSGPAGGVPRRRQDPVVASKPNADGLISAPATAGPRGADGNGPAPADRATPFAGVGRNEPCPCGSGKKFKKCHGATV